MAINIDVGNITETHINQNTHTSNASNRYYNNLAQLHKHQIMHIVLQVQNADYKIYLDLVDPGLNSAFTGFLNIVINVPKKGQGNHV